MNNKEQALKLIEGRIDTMTALSIECIELIYNAGYNDGIETAAECSEQQNVPQFYISEQIRKLKK